jgi:hypothetical protein
MAALEVKVEVNDKADICVKLVPKHREVPNYRVIYYIEQGLLSDSANILPGLEGIKNDMARMSTRIVKNK